MWKHSDRRTVDHRATVGNPTPQSIVLNRTVFHGKPRPAPQVLDEATPFRFIHPYLRKVYDAFGPQRFFWGTDLTRMPCSYRQCITMFTEELPWLSGAELEAVMGRALCDWIGWTFPFD